MSVTVVTRDNKGRIRKINDQHGPRSLALIQVAMDAGARCSDKQITTPFNDLGQRLEIHVH